MRPREGIGSLLITKDVEARIETFFMASPDTILLLVFFITFFTTVRWFLGVNLLSREGNSQTEVCSSGKSGKTIIWESLITLSCGFHGQLKLMKILFDELMAGKDRDS